MFSFNKNKLDTDKQTKTLWARLGIFSTLVIVVATSLSIAFSTQTNAANLTLSDNTDKGIQKLLLHRFLGFCLNSASLSGGVLFDNGGRITGNGPANKGDWFMNKDASLGPYFEDTRFNISQGSERGFPRTSGIGDCSDDATIKLAIDRLGGSGVDILCKIGFVRTDGSPCKEGNGDFRHANSALSGSNETYKAFMKAYPEPTLNDEGWYWFYRKTFNWTCGYGKMSNPVSKSVADASSDFGYSLTYVTNTAPFSETLHFIGLENKSKTVNTRLGEGGTTQSVNRTCAEIANHINDYGKKEAARLATLSPEDIDDIGNAPPATGDTDGSSGTGQSSCVVEGIGWIICPVMTFTASIVDAAYGFVDSLLKVQPIMTTGETEGVYSGWVVMRNIANVAFVIVFLFIIFSQLTGMGVSNYGVKKMLPRIVIAALLVNVSFWICAIAVDVSNILGSSMIQIFESIGATIPSKSNVVIADSGQGWLGLVGAVLAGGAAATVLYWVGLSALIPALLAAVLAILTVFIVLTLRQALIILLIVIAPLAFVAFILPNTEDWFSKWRKLLMTLLLMYPIIAAIFGASSLASIIVMNSSDDIAIQIMGACIAILPLAITPVVMKTAGGLLNRFAGIVNNVERGPVDRLKKVGREYRDNRNNLRDTKALKGANQLGRGAFTRWRARRGEEYGGVKSNKSRAQQQYTADAMTQQVTDENGVVSTQPTAFANRVAGGTMTSSANPADLQRVLANAKFTIEKAELEDIQAEKTFVSNLSSTEDVHKALGSGNNSNARTAALVDRLITIGKPDDYAGYVNKYGSDSSEKNSVLRQSIARSLGENGPKFLKGSNLDTIRTGGLGGAGASFENIAASNSAVYSEKNMVADTNDNIRYAYSVANDDGKKKLIETAVKLTQNPVLKGEIKHNEDAINFLVSQSSTPATVQVSTDGPSLVIAHSANEVHTAANEQGFNNPSAQTLQMPSNTSFTRPPQAPPAPEPPRNQSGTPAGQANTTINAAGQSSVIGQAEDTNERLSK